MRDGRRSGGARGLIVRLAMAALSCTTPALAATGDPCPEGDGLSLCSPSGARARESWMSAQESGSLDAPIEVPVEPEAAPDAPPGDPGAPPMRGLEWRLAPVRWGGNASYELRRLGVAGHAARLQQVETANLRGASYVWQPWFMQVSGGLGIVAGRERSRPEGDDSTAVGRSNSNTVTGSGALSVFPSSRFPFQASFDKTDSRASGDITSNDFTNTRWGARQNYRSGAGDLQYTGSWDRGTLESPSFGRDTVDVLSAGVIRSAGPQTLDFSGSRSRNWRGDTGDGSRIERVVARHGYRPDPLAAVETLASSSSSRFDLTANGAPSENRTRFDQASTFATWRAGQGSPLYLSGGGRVFRSSVDVNGAASDADTLSGNLAASYALSRHTTLNGAVTATRVTTDTAAQSTSNVITTESAGATYVPDATPLGGFLYTWNAAANAANQNGGVAEADASGARSRQNYGGQLGHNLTRSAPLSDASSVTYGAGQSYSSIYDTVTERSQTLTHNASVSVSSSPGSAATAFASLYGADARTHGHNENTFQIVNLQVNGQFQLSRWSLANANLTVQGVRQETPGAPPAGFNRSSGGNLTYQHLRAFDLPRLRYTAIYGANQIQYSSRLEGDVNAPRERVTRSFEQRLDWSVGRLDLQLSARTATIDGQRNELVFFRINRQFGAF
ncbi:MAG TPA: hypothetical protein VI319_00260 [Burkholderiales bacterium]